jgi:hypothetical protein
MIRYLPACLDVFDMMCFMYGPVIFEKLHTEKHSNAYWLAMAILRGLTQLFKKG